jgi:hypothetical protein
MFNPAILEVSGEAPELAYGQFTVMLPQLLDEEACSVVAELRSEDQGEGISLLTEPPIMGFVTGSTAHQGPKPP